MSSSTARIVSLDVLHPAFREKLSAVLKALSKENLPFEVYETFRLPARQAHLYAQGRTRPGNIVTKAKPWTSYHQYGLAADLVLKLDGEWSWRTDGDFRNKWRRLHEIADVHGLEPLSWELPHLQLKGHSGASLQMGDYPAFGDDAWAEFLSGAITEWTGGGAPPLPRVSQRPGIAPDEGELAREALPAEEPSATDDLARPAIPAEERSMSALAVFESIQSMIDKWEGGYVDHPEDPGGATNMGITQATLASWRGHPVTKEDVKSLSRAEQRQIMKARYYNVISGDDLPPGVAAVTYNAAILHGPKRAAIFLQTALARRNPAVRIDGAIGPITLAAARAQDGSVLISDFIAIELAFLKGLKHWPTFGKGWTNRLNDIRSFALRLSSDAIAMGFSLNEAGASPSLLRPAVGPEPHGDTSLKSGALGVDNMLGETIGKLLLGKKTTLGGLGTLVSMLLPTLGPPLGLDPSQASTAQDVALPLALTMLGWGGLGKIDRWVGLLKS